MKVAAPERDWSAEVEELLKNLRAVGTPFRAVWSVYSLTRELLYAMAERPPVPSSRAKDRFFRPVFIDEHGFVLMGIGPGGGCAHLCILPRRVHLFSRISPEHTARVGNPDSFEELAAALVAYGFAPAACMQMFELLVKYNLSCDTIFGAAIVHRDQEKERLLVASEGGRRSE